MAGVVGCAVMMIVILVDVYDILIGNGLGNLKVNVELLLSLL